MKIFRLGACLKCRGDLALDDGDWSCLQCGLYYYTGLYDESGPPKDPVLSIGYISFTPDDDCLSIPAWLADWS